MKKQIYTIYLLIFCCLPIFAQQIELETELINLQRAIDKVEALARILPTVGNGNFNNLFQTRIENVKQSYNKAKNHINQRQFVRAKVEIRAAQVELRQIERFLQNHRVFQVKFQETLDQKIQEAEALIQNNPSEESERLLNRAKFFRQRGQRLFNQNQTINAVEHFRLAIYFAEQATNTFALKRNGISREELQREYLNTKLLFDRAQAMLNSQSNRQMEQLFQKVDTEFQFAKQMYDRREFNSVQERLTAIQRALYRIIDQLESIPETSIDQLKIDIESLNFSLERMRPDVENSNNNAVKRIFNRATTLATRSENLIQREQFDLARRNIFFANQILVRLYRQMNRSTESQPDRLKIQLQIAEQNFSEISLTQNNAESLSNLKKLIKNNLDRAKQNYDDQDYLESAKYLKITTELQLQLNRIELHESNLNLKKTVVKQDLERLKSLINRFENAASDSVDQSMLDTAKSLLSLAETAWNEENLKSCNAFIQLAFRIITN